MKTEAYKLYSRVFWIVVLNVIKIDPYNFELVVVSGSGSGSSSGTGPGNALQRT